MMGAIGFYLFYAVNWIFTLLPLPILYLFSDLLYPLIYHIAGYRRKVVAENLRNAFPEMSDQERLDIEKKFYRHFCDLIVETIKLTHMSRDKMLKRNQLVNMELPDRYYDEGRDVVTIIAHYGNWEWMNIIPSCTRHRNIGIYKPLQNKYFDRFMVKLRTRFNGETLRMSKAVREIINNRRANSRAMYGFVSDQTPARGDIQFRTRFLNQDTPVFLGAEKIAVKFDMAVVYLNIQKVSRGRYKMIMEPLFEHSAGVPEYLITETHVKRLEEIIKEKPEYWLWSHRRWKYKRAGTDG